MKIFKTTAFTVLVVCIFCSCKNIKAPAPLGVHGEYSFASDTPIYVANGIDKDSILNALVAQNLTITNGRLNDYDASWDSLRYLIGGILCEDEKIEAYLEFKSKKAENITFRVLWFNAEPTEDDNLYIMRTGRYYECFETMLRKNKLIK